MKTKLSFFFLVSCFFCLVSLKAQIPQGFNYQAIARNGFGNPILNISLPVTITIQSDSLGGIIFWEELHPSVMTNNFGLFTLTIGKGVKQTTSTCPTFNDINWSIPQIFIKTQILYNSTLLNMGSSRLWSVPYSLTASKLSGPVDKLEVVGKTDVSDEALFEVKNKDGQTIFAVYNEGVRIYVDDGAKGPKGGFAVGGFDMTKGTKREYLVVSDDSVRVYLDSNPSTKGKKSGFAVGGYDLTKGSVQNYLDVSADSVRVYVDTDPSTKKLKGGFAVGGYDMTKGIDQEFLRVTSDSVKVSKSLLIPRLSTSERDNLPFIPGDALIIFNTTESCMQIFKNNVWSNIWCFNCAPSFIIQPVDQTICSGENIVFFVSATGTNLNYQWEESTDNGNTWNNISNGGTSPAYSGAKGYSISLSNVPVVYNNYKYRCVVSGSCLPYVTSNVVILNVGSTPPVITTQPTDQQLSTSCTANFNTVSPGYGVSYKWQQSTDGGSTWNNISNGGTSPVYSGATAGTLSLSNVPKTCINNKYRCIVSNLCGADATSNAATLTPNSPPEITVQPVNKLVYAGQNISFTITTSGSGYNYQWQESTNGGSTWSSITNGGSDPIYSGSNGTSLSLSSVPLPYNDYRYRCIVSHFCRLDAISSAATLSVSTPVPLTDIDGNTYGTVGIGSQLWMAENLKTTRYRNGDIIGTTTPATLDISGESTPKYQWAYAGNESNVATYGRLYTWYAATDSRNICPTGWHVPMDAELTSLNTYLGGTDVAGGKLKESGIAHWESPNTGATNEFGFTALPGGVRMNSFFGSIGITCHFWSATEYDVESAWFHYLSSLTSQMNHTDHSKKDGYSVRCLKD